MQKAVQDGRIKCFNLREGPADGDQDLDLWTRELEDVVREIMEDPVFKGNQNFSFELDVDAAGQRLFGGEANAGVAFQIGQVRYILGYTYIYYVHTSISCGEHVLYFVGHNRVGEGTVPLAIVVYIDGSYIKHKIPVKPIYVTVRNLNSVVSGKACAWRVLGMMPSLKKSATLAQTDSWRKDRRLRLHHAGLGHIVNMINKFGSDRISTFSVLMAR